MDENINKVVKTFMITDQDLSHFWKIFQKLDKAKTGLVSLNYMCVSLQRTGISLSMSMLLCKPIYT